MKIEKEVNNDLDEFVKLSFFADIGIGIAAAKSINDAMEQIMEKIGDIFAPCNWSLLLIDKEKDELYFKIATGESSDKLQDLRIPKDTGLAGWIVKNGKPAIVKDVSKDSRFSQHIDKITGFKTKSIIGVPLKVNNDVIGVIELINRLDKKPFSPTELKILTTIADYAAITIEKIYYLGLVKNMAKVDATTGVFNRRSFDDQLQKEIERCKRYGNTLALLMLDIDDLKKINDNSGHPAGDDVLKDIALIMKNNIRKIDIAARYGGDEFAIIMPHTKKHEGENVRQRIFKQIEKGNKTGKKIPYTVSIGLQASGPDKVANLLEMSDKDLLKQKKKRKVKSQNITKTSTKKKEK
jgi:diguanylate cyclase (GGDEF)-like protein